MALNVHGTFISEKVSKIRWRPDPFNNSSSFLTGSWDNDQNSLKLWIFEEVEGDADIYPFVVTTFPFIGDVTELKFANPDSFVVSSSSGTVYNLKINVNEQKITDIVEETTWKDLHKLPNGEQSSCTSLALYDKDIVTVGEDGRVNLLTLQSKEPLRIINDADSCSIYCVVFTKCNEILTSNSFGQMKTWDLRSNKNTPSSTFMLSLDHLATPTCLTYHPSRHHIVMAGDEAGSLTIWDLRQSTYPLNVLNAHDDALREIQFHPDYPDQLFSCSNAGQVWHWANSSIAQPSNKFYNIEEMETNSWFTTADMKNMEVYAVMPQLHKPINTIDLNKNRLLCGCDNEAVYLITDINIHL